MPERIHINSLEETLDDRDNSDFSDWDLEKLVREPISSSTRKSYSSRFDIFEEWGSNNDQNTFPSSPKVVQKFLVFEAKRGLSLSTIRSDVCAIGYYHRNEGYEDPTSSKRVRNTVRNIARKSTPPSQISRPIREKELVHMIRALPGGLEDGLKTGGTGKSPSIRAEADRLRGIRDRALLLVLFNGALRRSEGARIRCSHTSITDQGLEVFIPESKGDQVHEGQSVCIRRAESEELCATRELQRWLQEASITEGSIFRPVPHSGNIPAKARGPICGTTVNRRVKMAAAAAGLNAEEVSAHSLRYGHLITAAEEGASLADLQRHARHSDPQTTSRYILKADRMRTTTTRHLGL
jgi:integrase